MDKRIIGKRETENDIYEFSMQVLDHDEPDIGLFICNPIQSSLKS